MLAGKYKNSHKSPLLSTPQIPLINILLQSGTFVTNDELILTHTIF